MKRMHLRQSFLSWGVIFGLTALPVLVATASPGPVFAANVLEVAITNGGTSVNEFGSADSFTVRLSDAPSSNVVMSVTSADVSEVTASPASLTFTPIDWNVPKSVTVSSVDDGATDGDQTTEIVLSVVDSQSDANYRGGSLTVNVTTVDDEAAPSPGFAIIEPDGETKVAEANGSDTFRVVLRKQPSSSVTLNVTSSDTTEAEVSPASLTFSRGNWDTPRMVSVTGVDDTAADGHQRITIVISVNDGLSADEYDPLADQTMTVVVTDNEMPVAGLMVAQSDGDTTVSESGTSDSFSVMLTKAPNSSVTLAAVASDGTEATVSPSTLTFTPDNWNGPQTVTVTGVDDPEADGAQTSTVFLSILDAMSDNEYRAVSDQSVTVATLDDEPPQAGFVVRQSGGNTIVSESGGTDDFSVALNKAPDTDVTISITSADTTEATISPTHLTFTAGNWTVPQRVTVAGVDDDAADGDQTIAIVISVVDPLSDNAYDSVPDQAIQATTVDNDPRRSPGSLSPASGSKLSNLGPLLQWSQEVNTTWFHLQVIPFSNDGPGIDLMVGETVQVSLAQYQVLEPDFGSNSPNYLMLPDITYTWRVRTATALAMPIEADWTAWSTPATFQTATKTSSTISRVSPPERSTVSSRTPTLIWSNSDDTVFYYEVQVSRDPTFSTGAGAPFLYWELRHGGLTNPLGSYSVPSRYPLEPNTSYYWRTRPRVQGDGAPVAWSSTFSFESP
jgi:hypothetical protein